VLKKWNNILITELNLEADLWIPLGAKALILFAHGSGSGRHSTRNQYLAQALNNAGFGTLLVDLLNTQEKEIDSSTRHLRFDIDSLASRIESITNWLLQEPRTQNLSLGYFASSTGAAAALIASTRFNNIIKAIVSRGGRPDLAEDKLKLITSPTLLVVGGYDNVVVGINKRALKELKHAEAREMVVIPGAKHLFEEPGKMEDVAKVASEWFGCYLLRTGRRFENKYALSMAAGFWSALKDRSIQIRFKDRASAGEILASALGKYRNKDDVTVIGIASGGFVVADAVARKLGANLDIVVGRRIRSPYNSENAIGAVAQDGSVYLDERVIQELNISKEYIDSEVKKQKKEIEHRTNLFRPVPREYIVRGRIVMLIDDGAATGATIIGLARWIRKQEPRLLVIGVPVAPKNVVDLLAAEADYVEVISRPSTHKFKAIEYFYDDFSPVADDKVVQIVKQEYQR
jgi:predicted phosphoribosyltransferase/pimeloyl-ACP methyl ester carboxylesterase